MRLQNRRDRARVGATAIGAALVIVIILIIGAAVYLSAKPSTKSSIRSEESSLFSSVSSIMANKTIGMPGATSAVKVSIPAGSGTNQTSSGYSPDIITVIIGINNTVTWTNNDSVVHTVTDRGGSFNSNNISPGQSFTYTFTTPGTFEYHCTIHSWLHGTVIVKSK